MTSPSYPISCYLLRCLAALLLVTAAAGPAHAALQVLGGPGFTAGVANPGTNPNTSNGTDFGTVTLPDSESNIFRLKNNGSSAVTIIALTVDGASFDMISGGVAAGSPTNLAAGGSRDFTIRFDPSSVGSKSGSVAILTLTEPTFVFDLEGEAVGTPEIVVRGRPFSPAGYLNIGVNDLSPRVDDGTEFGNWGAADGSLTHTFEIENTGTDTLDIDSISIDQFSSAYSLSGVPSSVGAGAKKTFSVKFNPASNGAYTGTVTIQNNDSNEDPFTFAISGTGRASAITLFGGNAQTGLITNGDDSLSTNLGTDFGTVAAGSAAKSNTFKITNVGNEPLTFLSTIKESSNAFSITSSPAALSELAPGASTTFNVVLSTSTAGSKNATVTILTDDPNDGTFSFDVTAEATGDPEIVVEGELPTSGIRSEISFNDLSPVPTDGTHFGDRGVSDGGVAHSFFIKNTGNALLTIGSITDGSNQFSLSSVPSSVSVNGEQEFTVTFNPTSSGEKSATITINNNDSNENPFTFLVRGNGTAGMTEIGGGAGFATVIGNGDSTPSTDDNTDFGEVIASGAPKSKTFRIFNRGNANLLITSVAEDGNAWSLANVPLGVTLAPGGTRDFDVVLAPTSAGFKRATVTVSTNDPETPLYTFDVSGSAAGTPLLDVLGSFAGNYFPVINGATVSDLANGTDFGAYPVYSGALEREFQIVNTGNALLSITSITEGSPNFSVSSVPSTVGVGQTRTFKIKFNPISHGAKFANIVITTNSAGEESYIFRVDGVGTAGELAIRRVFDDGSKGPDILDGDTTPSFEEGTLWKIQLEQGGSGWYNLEYELRNTGNDTLTISRISNDNSLWDTEGNFPVTLAPGTKVNYYAIDFYPVVAGQEHTTVDIVLLNAATPLFTFDMAADVTGLVDFDLGGRSIDTGGTPFVSVPDAATIASSGNGTDFGEIDVDGGSVTHTFEITNTGTEQLQIAAITETSPHFTVAGVPGVVGANQNAEFTVKFNPNGIGPKSTKITIASNAEGDKASYTFVVKGRGEGSDIAVTGGVGFAENITNGDVMPTAADGTDFDNWNVSAGGLTKTFRIENRGNDTLNISAATTSNTLFTLAGVPGPLDSIAPDGVDQFSVTFDPTAVGKKSAVITIASNDPDENPFTFTVTGFGVDDQPQITISGPSGSVPNGGGPINLGEAQVGSTLVSTFSIENTGTGNLTISGITEGSALFSSSGLPPEPLQPGRSYDLSVLFQPTAAGTATTIFSVTSDSITDSAYTFSVQATGTTGVPFTPDIEVFGGRNQNVFITAGDTTPRRYDGTDLGQIAIGDSGERTFRIRNTGTVDLNISIVQVVSFPSAISTFPTSVAAGAFGDFTVTIAPTSEGVRNFTLRINSDDPDESPYEIAMLWEGVDATYPVAITSISLDGNNTELTFISNPFKTYRIAYSTDMQTWSRPAILSNITGDTAPQAYILVNALSILGSQGYFRVEEE